MLGIFFGFRASFRFSREEREGKLKKKVVSSFSTVTDSPFELFFHLSLIFFRFVWSSFFVLFSGRFFVFGSLLVQTMCTREIVTGETPYGHI